MIKDNPQWIKQIILDLSCDTTIIKDFHIPDNFNKLTIWHFTISELEFKDKFHSFLREDAIYKLNGLTVEGRSQYMEIKKYNPTTKIALVNVFVLYNPKNINERFD